LFHNVLRIYKARDFRRSHITGTYSHGLANIVLHSELKMNCVLILYTEMCKMSTKIT
jgi:hypothetical protein